MTTEAKTPRDVLMDCLGRGEMATLYNADKIERKLLAAGYQITPVVRDDGARVEAALDVWLMGDWSHIRKQLTPEGTKRRRDLMRDALAAADAVTGVGRDGDALDAARYRWVRENADADGVDAVLCRPAHEWDAAIDAALTTEPDA